MNKFTDRLNDRQKEAVLKTEGPLLILAGAGSGKTRVITNRIAYLIEEKGISPRQILAITFTNKAAAEMRERQEQMLGTSLSGAWICTFHSACVRILRMHAELLGYDSKFTIYDAEDQKNVIKNICKDMNIDPKQFKEKWFMGRISAAKDELLTVEQFERNASGDYRLEKAAKVFREYQRILKANNAFDFDDLIVKTVELFRTHPEVLDKYQERFRYISVDEYQDTNTAQFIFVSLLAGKYKNICVVGDDDQSIYKFRGANIKNILNFEKVFPGASVIRLEQNYRSTSNVLDAANAVIKNNVQRKAKTLWTEAEAGDKIRLFYVDNPYVEADRVIALIRKLQHDGGKLKDCACLYRTNAQSRNLEEAFIRADIPYKIVGGVNFYQRKEIKDILAYLKTIDNAVDDLAVKRIINVPKRGIGAVAVNMVQHLADERGISFYSALDSGIDEGVFGKTADKLAVFRNVIQGLRNKASSYGILSDNSLYDGNEKRGLKEFIQDVLDDSGYMRELTAENTVESESRIENLEEFINKAALFDEKYDRGASLSDTVDELLSAYEDNILGGFLEEVSLVADIDSWDASDEYVSLITIHSAKGLEFENVFLCGMEDGLFPMNASINSEDPSDLEEERRLAYVGITRAKKRLFLTAARTRMVRGETVTSKLSRFVREIPPLLIEHDSDNIYVKKADERPVGDPGTVRPKSRPQSRVILNEKPAALKYGHDFYAGGADAASKQFSANNKAKPDYTIGDRVSSMKYGEGTVTAIADGGKDYEITVDFDDFGTKKMFAAFARLEKI